MWWQNVTFPIRYTPFGCSYRDRQNNKKKMIGCKHLYCQLSADNDAEADNGWCMVACFGEEYRTLQSRQDVSLSGRSFHHHYHEEIWSTLNADMQICRHFIYCKQPRETGNYGLSDFPAVLKCGSYLEYIGGPSPSSSTPFHLGFVHHWAALFLADLIQNVVGLQEEDKSQFRNHCCNSVRGNKVSLQWARSEQKNHNYLIPITAPQLGECIGHLCIKGQLTLHELITHL